MKEKLKPERGTVLVLIASGIVALLGAVGLSVDTGYIFTFKNQLQNAVDAAALAGAQGLIVDPGNYSPNGRAMQLAVGYGALNAAGAKPVNLAPNEISFPKPNMIKIQITRPAHTFFMRIIGVSQINVQVVAAAMVVPARGGRRLRPFALLDQFGHGSLCVHPNDASINNPPHGDFKTSRHTWKGVTVDSDSYTSPYDPSFDGMDLSTMSDCGTVTGLIAPRDVDGQLVALKLGDTVTPGNFGGVALGGTGADTYRGNIVYGYDGYVQIGDILGTEPGNIVGPTAQSVDDLVARDPDARMVRTNAGNWTVVSSQYPVGESPRIISVPMYSPFDAPVNGRTIFKVASIASFFVERSGGQYVYGRFVQSRVVNALAGSAPRNSGSGTVSGGGRLPGTVQLVNPN